MQREKRMQNQIDLMKGSKGNILLSYIQIYMICLYLEVVYRTYSGAADLSGPAINVVINSACLVVCRTLKNME